MARAILPPIQQGQEDGFCGIYCLLNFFRSRERLGLRRQDKIDTKIFRSLFETIESIGFNWTPHVWDGFSAPKLHAVCGEFIIKHSLKYTLSEVRSSIILIGAPNIVELANAVVSNDGAIIIHLEDRYHWVLVTGDGKDGLIVHDSYLPDSPKVVTRFDEDYVDCNAVAQFDGLIILPYI